MPQVSSLPIFDSLEETRSYLDLFCANLKLMEEPPIRTTREDGICLRSTADGRHALNTGQSHIIWSDLPAILVERLNFAQPRVGTAWSVSGEPVEVLVEELKDPSLVMFASSNFVGGSFYSSLSVNPSHS